MNSEVLNSWKEIAAYLGRGVRTVQRWERELDLPVRRPRGKDRSAVIALKPDIDKWLQQVPQRSITQLAAAHPHQNLHLNTQRLLRRSQEILERSTRLQATLKDTMALVVQLKSQRAVGVRERAAYPEQQQVLLSHTTHFFAGVQADRQLEGQPEPELTPSAEAAAQR
jgi:hypothetical protein